MNKSHDVPTNIRPTIHQATMNQRGASMSGTRWIIHVPLTMAIAATVTAILVSAGHPVAVAQDIDRDHGTTVDMGAAPAIDGGLGDVRPNAEAGAQALPDLAAGPDRPDNGGALELPLGLVLPEAMPSPGLESTDGMDDDRWSTSGVVIRNLWTAKCIEHGTLTDGRPTEAVYQDPCHGRGSQTWYLLDSKRNTSSGKSLFFIHDGNVCLRVIQNSIVGWVRTKDCGPSDERVLWTVNTGLRTYGVNTHLQNYSSGRYLRSPNTSNEAGLSLTSDPCCTANGWLIYAW